MVFHIGVYAQQSGINLEFSLPIKAHYVAFDNLGYFYVANHDELSKYDLKGEFLLRESNKVLGDITTVDVTNPLKILVFYKDFGQIVFADTKLAARSQPLRLNEYGFVQSISACTSYDNGFWVFDQVTFQLTRLDRNFNVVNQTSNLQQVLGQELNPNYMREQGNWLYVNNPETGILVFDIYGTYYKTIPFKHLEKFSIYSNYLYVLEKGALLQYNLKTATTRTILLPEIKVNSFSVYENHLLLAGAKQLSLYRLILDKN
tara:strand:- start:9270 stop:10049 length:780 start_codon:yes stop_codon:yes gene_type:complete